MRGLMNIGSRPKRSRFPGRISPLAIFSFCAGAVLIAVGLELFLKPNRLVPGGAQGLSILLSHMTEMRLGLLLFVINMPFLFAGVRLRTERGSFRIRLAALGATAAVTLALEPVPPLTEHSLAASLLGGLSLGCGAGLILRLGGYTDSVSEAAFWLKRKVALSIAELVMLVNLSILALAGLLYGWEQALYSVVAYFVAYRSLRYTMKGYYRYTMVRIRSDRSGALRPDLRLLLGRDVPLLSSDDEKNQLTVIISRDQEAHVRRLLRETDPSATVSMVPLENVGRSEYNYLQH